MTKNSLLKFYFFILFFAIGLTSFAQNYKFEWVKHFGVDPQYTVGVGIVVDTNKFLISVGNFAGTVDFDGGVNVSNLSSNGFQDIYITKYDTAGNFIWAKQLGGIEGDRVLYIKQDLTGNLIIVGFFQNVVDFDPGVGVSNLTAIGLSQFVLKLDRDGNFIWVKQLETNDLDVVDIDPENNIILLGSFGGIVDFDPGPGVFLATTPIANSADMFVLKLTNDGNFIWVKQFMSLTTGQTQQSGLESDVEGNIYLTGNFTGSIDFDPNAGITSLTPVGVNDIFIAKLTKDGHFIWVKQIGSLNEEKPTALEIDNIGNIYASGYFTNSTVDFDPGVGTYFLTSNSLFPSCFVLKLDKNGNFLFAKNFEGAYSDGGVITIDSSNNLYIAGFFEGPVDFDPGPNVFNINEGCLFTTKLDANGNFIWAIAYLKQIIGSGGSIADIKVDVLKNIYTTGLVSIPLDFDPNFPVYTVTPNSFGIGDGFIHKLSQCKSSLNQLIITSCKPYTLNATTYNTSGTYYQTLTNSIGCDSVIELTLSIQPIQKNITINNCGSYNWNGTILSNTGAYTQIFSLPSGCDSTVNLNLIVNEKPVPNLGKDTSVCKGKLVVLSPGIFNSYEWSNTTTAPTLNVKDTGRYWVKVVNSTGCFAYDTIFVAPSTKCIPIFIPNAFTPNADNLNDVFKPIINVPVDNYQMSIYNRWGQIIFNTRNVLRGWDGKFKNSIQHTGTFVYEIKFKINGFPYSFTDNFILIH